MSLAVNKPVQMPQKTDSNKQPGWVKHFGGVLGGVYVISAVNPTVGFINRGILNNLKTDKELGISQAQVENVFSKMYYTYKLDRAKLFYLLPDPKSAEGIKLIRESGGAAFRFGKAGSFFQVIATSDKKHLLLHELGHASTTICSKLRRNSLKYFNIFKILKHMQNVGVPIAIGCALARREDKPQKGDNFYKFLEKHIGVIAALPFIPTLIEEASATLKALKFTKKYEPSMLIPLRRNLGLAYLTYVAHAALSVAGAKLAVYVKNKIESENKP